jgi:hypothetical protein
MRKMAIALAAAAFIFTLGTSMSRAQENSSKPEDKKSEERRPLVAYHLDFTLDEMQEGKKINTRQYSMNLVAIPSTGPRYPIGYGRNLKIGTRVPIEGEQSKTDYLDIGTRISCQLVADDTGQLALDVNAEVSSLVPRVEADKYIPSGRDPILRELSIQASTTVVPGKLTNLGTVDDPDSKRQFQLEVTAEKLK